MRIALEEQQGAEEQWAIGYTDVELGVEIGTGNQQGRAERVGWPGEKEQREESRGLGMELWCQVATFVRVESSLALGPHHHQDAVGQNSSPQARCLEPPGSRHISVLSASSTTPPSSVAGPDEGRPLGQPSRRAPRAHTGHAGTGPRRGQV